MDAEYVDICHYGVLGMKWGRRKNPLESISRYAYRVSAVIYNGSLSN